MQAFDSIEGGLGNNSLQAVLNASVRPLALNKIQEVSATAMTAAVTLDLLNAPDTVTVANIQSSTDLTFTNLVAGANDLVVVAPDAGVDTVFAYASTTGTQTVNLEVDGLASGGTASVVTIAGIETINVTTVDTASVFTLTADAATTVNISGNKNLNLSGATVATAINASTFTGNLTAALSVAGTLTGGSGNDTLTGANNVAATISGGNGDDSIIAGNVSSTAHADSMSGGAGNDTFTFADGLVFNTATATNNDTVDGGTGTADVLVGVSAAFAGLSAPVLQSISNIEQISISDGINGEVNLAEIQAGISQVNMLDTQTDNASTIIFDTGVNSTVTLANNKDLDNDKTFTVTAAGSSNTDSTTFSVLGSTANNALNGGVMVFSGYENVTINTGSGTTINALATLDINATTASSNVSLTLAGVAGFDAATDITTNSTGLLSINASGLTAATGTVLDIASIITGTAGTISITGSSGNDVLGVDASPDVVLSDSATTISAGAGADWVYTGSAADSIDGGRGDDTLNSGTGNDTVRGAEGNDTITTGSGNVSVDGGSGNDTITVTTGTALVDGGEGNDVISIGSTLNETDVINGGAGIDTLTVTAAVTSPAIGNVVTNVETLNVNLTTVLSQDLSMFGNTAITKVISNTTGANITVSNAGATFDNLTLTGAAPGAITVSRSTAADSVATALTLSYEEGSAETATSLTVNDEPTLTINTTASSDFTITTLNAAELVTLNATGVANVIITNAIAGSTTISTISNQLTGSAVFTANATNNTAAITFTAGASTGRSTITTGSGNDLVTAGAGALYATLGSGNDSATGGAGADSLTGGTGNDTLIGGAENDTLVGGEGADSIDGGTGTADFFSAAGMNGVTDGGSVSTSGAVINLSSSTLIAANINTATSLFTANNGAGNINIATGQAAYLGSTGNNLSTIIDTLSNIENVIGSAGTDYIVGSSGANNLQGAEGADTIVAGGGNDTITGGTGGDRIILDATGQIVNYTANSETFASAVTSGTTLLTGVDVVDLSALAATNTARVNVSYATSVTGTTVATSLLNGTSGVAAAVAGSYDAATGVFTADTASASNDDLAIQWDANGSTAGGVQTIILIGAWEGAVATTTLASGVLTVTLVA